MIYQRGNSRPSTLFRIRAQEESSEVYSHDGNVRPRSQAADDVDDFTG